MRTLSFFFLLTILFFGCGNNSSNQEDSAENGDVYEEVAEDYQYTLSPFSESAQFPDAAINDMEYRDGKFTFDIGGDYQLGVQTPDADQKMCANSAEGQHIHVIVDNEPYSAHYTREFDYDMADGDHYLLTFLSRSYHESIKTPGAHSARKITVTNKTITDASNITQPMLFYSRPKGTYTGKQETEKVMLDFFLVNAKLSDSEYRVKAEINGEVHMIDQWEPYYISGLPMGQNTITLTLVDQDGNTVDAPLNPVTRQFELKADPAEAQ